MFLVRSRRSRTKALAVALLATPLVLVGLSACASTAPQHSGSSDSAKSKSMSFEDYQLKLSQCMRDQGVDQSDPGAQGQGIVIHGGGADVGPAMKACQEKLGPAPAPSAAEKEKMQQEAQRNLVSIAQCYRASGVDVPDPQPGQGLKVPSDAPADVTAKCGGAKGAAAWTAG